jgi:hypothetical protein
MTVKFKFLLTLSTHSSYGSEITQILFLRSLQISSYNVWAEPSKAFPKCNKNDTTSTSERIRAHKLIVQRHLKQTTKERQN